MLFNRMFNSDYDDDSFEFVDYSSISNFERLTSAIEEVLLSWGINNHSYGVLTSTTLLDYSRNTRVSFGAENYSLTYYCHPHAIDQDSSTSTHPPFIFDSYYQFEPPMLDASSETTALPYHPLHRWTGLKRLIILDSLSVSTKGSSKTISIDHSQAKVLLTACTRAINNVRCSVPIFIYRQPHRHGKYSGYSLQSHSKMDLELQFSSQVLPSPSCPLTYLETSFFEQLNANRLNNGLLPLASMENLNILKTMVLTYHLKNWFSTNWKTWEGGDSGSSTTKAKTTVLPELSFGSYNDPLRTMTLSALFPLEMDKTNHHQTHDSITHNNLDPFSATYWDLTLEFAPSSQKRALLSTPLENSVASWVSTTSSPNRQSLDPDNSSTKNHESIGRRHSTKLMQNILYAIGQNKRDDDMQPRDTTSGIIQSAQVDSIVKSLFNSDVNTWDDVHVHGDKNKRNSMDYIKLRNANADLSILTASSLGSRIKFGSTVPRNSFLWNFVVYQMDLLQRLDIGGHRDSSSGMDMLKACWTEMLRKFRWHWENLIPIPNVNPFIYTKHNFQTGSHLGIDLGYSIVHQKLAMINCCIHQSIKELPTNDHPSPPLTPKYANSAAPLKDTAEHNKDDILVDKCSSIRIDAKNERLKCAATRSDISESELFDFMGDDDMGRPTSTVMDQQHMSNNLEMKNQSQVSFAPVSCSWSSSISDLVDPASLASTHSSFVGLDYSTSAESDPCQYKSISVNENDNWSTNIHKSSPELQDPDAFEGRSHQHESILLVKAKTPLWVPVTQNSGFMTEDMIQQQADAFESLGTSDDATQLRAKLQSAQLKSDMQAFKAANPHATLGDFVRWYSPKDWIEDENDLSKGRLSARMSHPTNIWQDLWKRAQRIPASRQPPLFNLTAEGEKALYYLEHLPSHELFSLLLPTMALVVYDTLVSHPVVEYIRPVAIGLYYLATELINFPWDALGNGVTDFSRITSMVKQEESLMCNAISLLRKIPKQYDLVERLLVGSCVRLEGGNERTAIFNLYKDQDIMPNPTCLEFVFYMNNSLNIDHPLPLRQYSLLKDNKLRQLDMCCIAHCH